MTERGSRLVSMILAACLLAVAPAFAQGDGLAWVVHRLDDGGVSVVRENPDPDTDFQIVALTCDAETRVLRMLYYVTPEARGNQPDPGGVYDAQTTWSSDGGTFELAMRGRQAEPDAEEFFVEAETRLTPALIRVLTTGRKLTVRIQGAAGRPVEIPLAGSAEGMAALVQACGAR